MKKYFFVILILLFLTIPLCAEENTVTINFVGDILLDPAYHDDGNYPFKYIESELKNADITAGNLECPISLRGYPNPGKDPDAVKAGKEYIFRAPPELGKSLVSAGIDIVTLANNHSMDYGDDAIYDTLDFFERE